MTKSKRKSKKVFLKRSRKNTNNIQENIQENIQKNIQKNILKNNEPFLWGQEDLEIISRICQQQLDTEPSQQKISFQKVFEKVVHGLSQGTLYVFSNMIAGFKQGLTCGTLFSVILMVPVAILCCGTGDEWKESPYDCIMFCVLCSLMSGISTLGFCCIAGMLLNVLNPSGSNRRKF